MSIELRQRSPLGSFYRSPLGAFGAFAESESVLDAAIGFNFSYGPLPSTPSNSTWCPSGSRRNHIQQTSVRNQGLTDNDLLTETLHYFQFADLSVVDLSGARNCFQATGIQNINGNDYGLGFWTVFPPALPTYRWRIDFFKSQENQNAPLPTDSAKEGFCYLIVDPSPPSPALQPIADRGISAGNLAIVPLSINDDVATVCSIVSGPAWATVNRLNSTLPYPWQLLLQPPPGTSGDFPVTVRAANGWGFSDQSLTVTVT